MLTVLGLTFLATVLVGVPIAFSLGLAAAATLVAWSVGDKQEMGHRATPPTEDQSPRYSAADA